MKATQSLPRRSAGVAGLSGSELSGLTYFGTWTMKACFRWRLEEPQSDPGLVSLLGARWLSILSMPRTPSSSRIGRDSDLTNGSPESIMHRMK